MNDKNKDKLSQRSLVENKLAAGKYGGFSFGGQMPGGVSVHKPLAKGTVFPNGAKTALLFTFDVEGTYGNGTGDMQLEIANYKRICERLKERQIPATFNVVGKMIEEQGTEFVKWMLDAGCEVATHGYVHDMNKLFGGDKIYAGYYGYEENLRQIQDGIEVINSISPDTVKGMRLPYGHFNEYSYDAAEHLGLSWSSNVGSDDFIVPGQGFGGSPFQMRLGEKLYPVVEIPLDNQTYDWAIWVADEKANPQFVQTVRSYCQSRGIEFERTPKGALKIWQQRIRETIETESVFSLLCHPINLTVKSSRWSDPVAELIFPVIDELGKLNENGQAWVCSCARITEFYWQEMKSDSKDD